MASGKKRSARARSDATENADQAELEAFIKGSAPVAVGALDERLADAEDDYQGDPSLQLQDWERDKAYEETIGATGTEIDRRAALLKTAYPFVRAGGKLMHKPGRQHLYELLLCISLAPSYSRGRYRYLPRAFEAICCLLAEAYLGGNAGSYRMGWPRPAGMPKTFKAAVLDLHEKSGRHTGDWHWQPKTGNPEDPTPQVAKEQGLDVVAWKIAPDGRAGQLYLLGQCACGKNWDSDLKLQDLNLKTLHEWISEIAAVPPMRAIFTPRHAPDERLPRLSRQAGLIFDRARLTLLATATQPSTVLNKHGRALQRLTRMCLP